MANRLRCRKFMPIMPLRKSPARCRAFPARGQGFHRMKAAGKTCGTIGDRIDPRSPRRFPCFSGGLHRDQSTDGRRKSRAPRSNTTSLPDRQRARPDATTTSTVAGAAVCLRLRLDAPDASSRTTATHYDSGVSRWKTVPAVLALPILRKGIPRGKGKSDGEIAVSHPPAAGRRLR